MKIDQNREKENMIAIFISIGIIIAGIILSVITQLF
jgi:hypothetical protein